MATHVVQGDLLKPDADAIVMTIDGSGPGLEGTIARDFARKYPTAWSNIASQILYPISLGGADAFLVQGESDFDRRLVILVSTLHHLESLSHGEKLAVIRSALKSAVDLARINKSKSVASAILSGGWRLPMFAAISEMVDSYFQLAIRVSLPELEINVLDADELEKLVMELGRRHYLVVTKSRRGYEIDRAR